MQGVLGANIASGSEQMESKTNRKHRSYCNLPSVHALQVDINGVSNEVREVT